MTVSCFCCATELPKTPILCKPFENAFEQAFKIAGINPHKTVRKVMLQCLYILVEDQIDPLSLFLQLFFDDSIRNLQSAKKMGMHTVWVCYCE